MVLDFQPLFAATRQIKISAPFQSVSTVAGEKDSNELSSKFSSSAAALWDKIIGWRDILAFFILLNVLHLSIATKQQSSATKA